MSFSPRILPVILSIFLGIWACLELYSFVSSTNISNLECLDTACTFSPQCQQRWWRKRLASGFLIPAKGSKHVNGHVTELEDGTGEETTNPSRSSFRADGRTNVIPNFVFDHAPLVHLHAEEKYWPGDMQEHLDHVTPKLNYTAIAAHSPELDQLDSLNEWERGWSVFLTSKDDPEELPPWLGGEKNSPNPYDQNQVVHDKSKLSINIPGVAAADQRPLNTAPVPSIAPSEAKRLRPGYSPAPAVLVMIEKPDNITDAFWFFFYSFNLGNTVFNVRFGNHVGDWEHTLIRFQHGKPIEAFLSEHNFGSSYTFDALEKYLERDDDGVVQGRRRKKAVRASGKWKADRPIVYSGIGTHAMYATPGRHTYVLPFGLLHDETSRGPLWDPTLNLLSYTYTLPSPASPLPSLQPDSKRNPNAPTGWFFFNGHWGDKGYEMEDPRQYEFVGQKHYVSGPVGPRFKALGRKHICPSYEGNCLIRDDKSKASFTTASRLGKAGYERVVYDGFAWCLRHRTLHSGACWFLDGGYGGDDTNLIIVHEGGGQRVGIKSPAWMQYFEYWKPKSLGMLAMGFIMHMKSGFYSSNLRPPGPTQSVYRDDCTQCFDSIDDPAGLDVCLSCFNGGCPGERQHAKIHYQSFGHPLALNIKRTRKKIQRDEPPQKITKLAIAAETEEDRYETATRVKCFECDADDVDATAGKLPAVIDGVLKASTFARQAEVKAWEQEMTPCEHTLTLQQEASKRIQSQDLGHCSTCELKENLWLCLQCGNLGCGRAQFGGIKGNGHGLAHADGTAHPLAVKLGSITPEGTADVYCYACNDERVDPDLARHLAHWGIDLATREKTEKSLTELNVEQNLRGDFAMVSHDGRELPPLFGAGLTGLKNLGNSCYLASMLQCLFALPAFRQRFFHPRELPPHTPTPADDLETQLRKVADGLLSGRYSYPDADVAAASESSPELAHQRGLAPAMLKHLVGRGHEEFSTMRQQDAFELLLHLLKLVTRSAHPAPLRDPVASFRFVLEQRLQCLACHKVRYRSDEQDNISIPVPVRRISASTSAPDDSTATTGGNKENAKDQFEPVTLKECLDIFTAAEHVDLTCPACANARAGFAKRTRFKTFPATLAINARRFELVNWVPTKLDVAVVVGDAPLDLTPYRSPGKQDGEELLPEEDDATTSGGGGGVAFRPNEAALQQLEAMGFPRARGERALHATGNGDADAAMNWLFAHMEDADIDEPLALEAGTAGGGGGGGGGGAAVAGVSEESIATLGAMGIAEPQARKALRETGGDVNRALDWVFSHPDDVGDFGGGEEEGGGEGREKEKEKEEAGSAEVPARFGLKGIVCHKGGSIHAGHYVAFIRKRLPPSQEGDGSGGGGEAEEEEGEMAWVLFNDEKVVRAGDDVQEMMKTAYVYFFERV